VVFELGTGKKVMLQALGSGKQNIILDLSTLSAGVYGYRLEGNCPCPEPKKLIVVK
jgi:hypothetical protein